MIYQPYDSLNGRPNVVVDGFGTDGTLLVLSHWPGAGCPPELADDLSTQIVFRYLDRPDLRVEADYVSNNHFDEDGLCGIWSLLNPSDALTRRAQLVEVASAGDFGTFQDRTAARVAMTLTAYASRDRSPLDADIFSLPYPTQTARLYEATLPLLPDILDRPDAYERYWGEDDARLARDEDRLRTGASTIEERPDIDLAVVTVADGNADPHEWAINNATRRLRILVLNGRRSSLRYRYETWVRYISSPVMPRLDLAPLAENLNGRERNGSWRFDGVEDITPSLHLEGAGESSIAPDDLRSTVERFLEAAAPK